VSAAQDTRAAKQAAATLLARGITWEKFSAAEKAWMQANDPECFASLLEDYRARKAMGRAE